MVKKLLKPGVKKRAIARSVKGSYSFRFNEKLMADLRSCLAEGDNVTSLLEQLMREYIEDCRRG